MSAIYPVEPWSVTETAFDVANNYRGETTFALSNGYFGTRGTFEEGYDFAEDTGLEGNFIGGFYENGKVRYGEWNFGFPTDSQTMLNLPNCKLIRLWAEDERFDMTKGRIEEYRRSLELDKGLLTRTVVWRSPGGRRLRLETERLVSLTEKNLMAIRWRVTPLNFSGRLTVESSIDGDVENHTRTTNPLVDYGPFGRCLEPDIIAADDGGQYLEAPAKNTRMTMACGCRHVLCGSAGAEHSADKYSCCTVFRFSAGQGETVGVDKLIAYASSREMPRARLRGFVTDALAGADYDALRSAQIAKMRDFWENGGVNFGGSDELAQGLRFNLFHIMQAAARDGRTGMCAKGLTGEGYEGHYFWDTEMYALPVLTLTAPETARKLLEYRFHTLGQARERARV